MQMKTWSTPKVVEIVVSMEITAYMSAEIPDERN
jgi:coenzyme PQQ precursor peptide PqqA